MSRQMPDGIDLLEFLAETWRVKWRFLGIVLALMVVFALTPFLFEATRKISGGSEPVNVRRYVIGVTSNRSKQPYDFDYLSDVLRRAKKYDKAGFVFIGEIPKDAKVPPLNYEYKETPGGYFINIKTPDAGDDLVGAFRKALMEASGEQFQDVVRQVRQDTTLADRMIAESRGQVSDPLVYKAFQFHHFLSLPEVSDGTMRFIQIGELYSFPPQKESSMKIPIIGALSGFILACFYVVARIALSRASKPQD